MPTRARIALLGTAAGGAALLLTWYAAFHVAFLARIDGAVLTGFAGLHRPRLDAVTNLIAHLCDAVPYAVLASVVITTALLRGRRRVAALAAVVMLVANGVTELLKPLLAAPRPEQVPGGTVMLSSWPSGHATAAMALALCAVLVAPARRRPVVGAVMAAFTIAVCYSFLELGWHYPSDVIGGFLVAGVTALAGVAGLESYEHRRAERRVRGAPQLPGSGGERISVRAALRPVVILVAGALVLGLAGLGLRPHPVLAYASQHTVFVLGAGAIATCGLLLAVGAVLGLSGSGLAPRAAPRRGSRRG